MKYQTALDHISKVTMTMPINDEIVALQRCIDELKETKEELEKTKKALSEALNKEDR